MNIPAQKVVPFFIIGLLMVGCTRGPQKAQPESTPSSVPDSQPSSAPSPPSADISEKEVKLFVEQWLKSQNDGDFPTYQSLYAQRFTGIRRSGPRTVHLDREGWMKDRGRMFQKPMKVEAAGLTFSTSLSSAVVRFEQTWASPTYKDTGEKQMVLVKESGGLKIAREEMLASQEKKVDLTQNGSFYHVIPEGVVVGINPAPKLKTGPLQLISRQGPMIVRRPVDPVLLPDEIKNLIGKKLKLMNESKEICETTLNDFFVVKRIGPHFGTLQVWNGEEGRGPRLSDDKVAEEAWKFFEGQDDGTFILLVGDVKGCKGAAWGRLASLPPPAISRTESADREWTDAALKQFRKLPAYQSIQKSFESEVDSKEKKTRYWENYEGAKPTVRLFHPPGGKNPLVSVNAKSGYGCGGFEGALWALWELSGSDNPKTAQFKLLNNPDFGSYVEAQNAIDVENDGRFEILVREGDGTQSGLVRRQEGVLQEIEIFSIPIFDCPC